MCNPAVIPMVTLAIAAASTTMQYVDAKKQSKAADEAYQADYAQQMETAKKQQVQTTAQEANTQLEIARQAKREQAYLRVAAGESGAGGLNMMGILNDTFTQAGFETAKNTRNFQNQKEQTALEAKGLASRNQSGINQIQRPNAGAAGLQIAGAAMSSYAQQQSLDRQIKMDKRLGIS